MSVLVNVILAAANLGGLGNDRFDSGAARQGQTWVLRSVAARPAACLVPAERQLPLRTTAVLAAVFSSRRWRWPTL